MSRPKQLGGDASQHSYMPVALTRGPLEPESSFGSLHGVCGVTSSSPSTCSNNLDDPLFVLLAIRSPRVYRLWKAFFASLPRWEPVEGLSSVIRMSRSGGNLTHPKDTSPSKWEGLFSYRAKGKKVQGKAAEVIPRRSSSGDGVGDDEQECAKEGGEDADGPASDADPGNDDDLGYAKPVAGPAESRQFIRIIVPATAPVWPAGAFVNVLDDTSPHQGRYHGPLNSTLALNQSPEINDEGNRLAVQDSMGLQDSPTDGIWTSRRAQELQEVWDLVDLR